MNIILKAFDGEYCKEILEATFGDRELGTVISVMNHEKQRPNLRWKQHIWIPAEPQRAGNYDDVDWPKLIALDEELIEQMRPYEAVFLTMIERYTKKREMSYEERKRQYFDHLRFWNHQLATHKIDLLLMNTLPHQCYDWVLYGLCKLKGIPTPYIERCYIVDAFYLVDDWETSAIELGERTAALQRRYAKNDEAIELSPMYEATFRAHTQENADPWYMYSRSKRMTRTHFVHKWGGEAARLLWHKPKKFLNAVTSPEVWSRRMEQHKIALLWDQLAEVPDLKKPYIYVPLHFQPEATTCPMSGPFNDQELLVQLLAAHVPPDIQIYVKEHPAQDEVCRSERTYRAMHEIPNVTLVPRDVSTFALTDNAIAVATGTGTAGFEAIFRSTPVLMFGHRFYQYAPGVYRIRTHEDCTRAIDAIVKRKERPSKRDARIFLKALEETGTPYVNSKMNPDPAVNAQKAVMMGKKMAERLEEFFRNSSIE